MKKLTKVAALLSAGALLFGGLFLSCDSGDDDDDPVLKGIVAGGTLAATATGNTFSVDGVNVYAYYDNAEVGSYSEPGDANTYKIVTNDATYTAKNGSISKELKKGSTIDLDAGTYEVTVSYGGKTAADTLTLTVYSSIITGDAWWTVFAKDSDV